MLRKFDALVQLAIIIAMPKTLSFRIVYAESVHEHLSAIQSKYLSLIRNTIETQLRFEPHIETRNRKP